MHTISWRWRRTLGTLAVVAIAAATGCRREAPPEPTGAVLYERYCASCHGPGGRGDGPVAAALTTPPTDLRRLDYGVPEIMQQIDGRAVIRAHGTSAMPVWGQVFEESLLDDPHTRRTALLQGRMIADHVASLRSAE
jgi:mono/diheme cytochrome c family protein